MLAKPAFEQTMVTGKRLCVPKGEVWFERRLPTVISFYTLYYTKPRSRDNVARTIEAPLPVPSKILEVFLGIFYSRFFVLVSKSPKGFSRTK